VILFEAGMALRVSDLLKSFTLVKRVVLIGIPLGFILGFLAAYYLGALSWPVALMFGAITVVSGPAVIHPLIHDIALKPRIANCLKWESIINDPAGAIFAVLVFHHLPGSVFDYSWPHLFLGILKIMLVAGFLAIVGACIITVSGKRGWMPNRLRGTVMLAIVLIFYAIAENIHTGAGLVAVTLFGLFVGNMQTKDDAGHLFIEMQYMTLVLVSMLFIIFGSNIRLGELTAFSWHDIALLAGMLFVVRPAAIILSTIGANVTYRERIFLSLIGPKGIVAVSMAALYSSQLLEQGYPGAERFVILIMALSLISVIVSGSGIRSLAAKLKVLER
jgi:NhaP-type Na+/H+ or K+/H+ antiporter